MVRLARCRRCSKLLKPWEITTCGRCLTKLIKEERSKHCYARGKKKKGKK